MDQELKAFLKESFESIDRRFESIDRRFDRLEETVRYTQITVEALESKVELVAEGVVCANERIDALRKETKEDHSELRSLMTLSLTDLGKRVRVLEERKSTRATPRRNA